MHILHSLNNVVLLPTRDHLYEISSTAHSRIKNQFNVSKCCMNPKLSDWILNGRLRSTCHGISAAAGKAGAIVGAFGFLYAAQGKHHHTKEKGYPNGIGIKNAFLLLSLINMAGFFCTFLLPETKGRSLEDLSGENDEDQRDEGSIHHQFSLSKHPWNLEVPAHPVEYLSTNERRVGYGT